MRTNAGCLAVAVLGMFSGAAKGMLTLYDGTKTGLPQTQGSLAYENVLGTATETLTAGNVGPVTLNSTASILEYAGLSNYNSTPALVNSAFPSLSPGTGFDLTFSAKVDTESHTSNDRAGFSVILLGSDLSGIELGFWGNQVWAQGTNAGNPSLDFNHSEGTTNFNTSTGFHSYDLHIQGSTYSLFADGSLILTGPTRNYSAYPTPAGFPDPYAIPNFVFLGDDTNDGEATTEINSIAISVPEPGSVSLLGAATSMTLLRRRKRQSC